MSRPAAPPFASLPRAARGYILLLALIAAVMATFAARADHVGTEQLVLLGVLLVVCAGSNLSEVFMPGNYSFQPNFAFIFLAGLLLPGWLLAAVAVACFLPAVLLGRQPWYKAAFNSANYVVCAILAASIVVGHGGAPLVQPSFGVVASLIAAAAAFAALNHLLIVFAVLGAGERSWRTAMRAMLPGLPIDIALGLTGACLAALWQAAPSLGLLAAGPLFLVFRALSVPLLEHKARTDSKTGLANFEQLDQALDSMLESARRARSSGALVMLDLDHFGAFNNTYGHVAGDRVIRSVAEILVEVTENSGIAGRFGGEEFCLLLPNASVESARALAEHVRERVAEIQLREVDGANARVTISAGVATFPGHALQKQELLEAADEAVYAAKRDGRDRVCVAPMPTAVDEPAAPVRPAPVLRRLADSTV